MHTGYASDIEALLHRAGATGLVYRQFRNPPTRRSPPPEAGEAEAAPAAAAAAREAPDVFPVPPMASVLDLGRAPAARTAGPGGDGARHGMAEAFRAPPTLAAMPPPDAGPAAPVRPNPGGAAVRLPLVEAALSATQPAPPPAGSTLARLRAAVR